MKIKELIERLAKFDPDTDVVIVDADTGWYLVIHKVEQETGEPCVVVGGNYRDQYELAGE